MKKVDLHTHTICTPSDAKFNFSLDAIKKYIELAKVDCIAITNHNIFDREQYDAICNEVDILVLPGIEVDLENGHLLLISCNTDVDKFSAEASKISSLFTNGRHTITFEEFNSIVLSFEKRILIPHSDKKPEIHQDVIKRFGNYITCGEVANPKKFIKYKKNGDYPTPVIFSDLRFDISRSAKFNSKCTYIQIGDLTFESLKFALADKSKVHLTPDEGKNLIECLGGTVKISSGLNVVLGKRASGKSYLLSELYEENNIYEDSRVKYIRQFELQKIEDTQLDSEIRNADSLFIEDYLRPINNLTQKIIEIDIDSNLKSLDKYVESLKKYASHTERHDAFSKTKIFSETKFQIIENNESHEILISLEKIIDNSTYKKIIESKVSLDKLKELFSEILKLHRKKMLEIELKKISNDLISKIKDDLFLKTSAERVSEVNPAQVIRDSVKSP